MKASLLFVIPFVRALHAAPIISEAVSTNDSISLGVAPDIQCPMDYQGVNQYQYIASAIAASRQIAASALAAVGHGDQSAVFKAVFKNHHSDDRLREIFSKASTLPRTQDQVPTFICVNTFARAHGYGMRTENWEGCQRTGIPVLASQDRRHGFLLLVCPAFFQRTRPDLPLPDPSLCPSVNPDNTIKPGAKWPRSSGTLLSLFSIFYYGDLPKPRGIPDPSELKLEALLLKATNKETATSLVALLMFGLYLTRPPWTNPQLSTTSTNNLTMFGDEMYEESPENFDVMSVN